ncbi:ATP-binding protein [uncultured Nocardioides sp.]|uniref:uridine kinase family protein n=1 Tax=uncultured Nocardioides sp. TaxID=198441 RepID=UPI00262F0416|nr:ATP-binding protein [uncultured Nocardioides sp.]
MPARVIVLAGPSGSGKSRLAERLALPVLRLDDFYKSGGDPSLPLITHGPNEGLVDWDHPDSWLPDEGVAALVELCRTGEVDVPVYEIARNGRTGTQRLHLDGAPLVVAEGIFAPDVVEPLREAGVLAAAFCVRRPAPVTFLLRLQRDLRERRKPPLMLVRRGVALMREQRHVVADAVAKGCEAVGLREAEGRVAALRESTRA